mmetsp:Transcript_27978/g.40045  ORF Transcript_27978/g.40045 Transcript_27978/m.40045 type:complete len:201 (+) Transcript_27978:1568-2170(+)
MVIPYRVVQTQCFVALAPQVTGTLILLDDDGWNTKLAQPCPKSNTTLTSANYKNIRLRFVTQQANFFFALLLPRFCSNVIVMVGANGTSKALLLLVALEFDHGSEQCPYLPIAHANESITSGNLGFKVHPAFENSIIRLFGIFGDAPTGWLHSGQAVVQHIAYLITTVHGDNVPREGDEITPVTVLCKQRDSRLDIRLTQ